MFGGFFKTARKGGEGGALPSGDASAMAVLRDGQDPTAKVWTRRERRDLAKETRDRGRGYAINVKGLCLSYVIELGVIVAQLIAVWQFAEQYTRDNNSFALMMVAAVLVSFVELSRVPLAIMLRTQRGLVPKLIALAGVLGVTAMTARALVMIYSGQFTPFLAEVDRKALALNEARSRKASIVAEIKAKTDALTAAENTYEKAAASATDSGKGVAQLPAQQCSKQAYRLKNGRTAYATNCTEDPRTKPLLGLATAANDTARAAAADVVKARAELNALNVTASDLDLAQAEAALREAKTNSPMHLLAASALVTCSPSFLQS